MVVNDWVKVKLGDVCSISAPMVDPRDSEYAYLPHIGNENIEKHSGLLLSYNKVIDDNLISGKYLFDEGDILYGKINPQFGKVAYPGFRGLCSADIYPISCGPRIIPEFLKYVLLSYSFLKYTVALSQRSGMPKVNREEVIKYEFSLPSIIEQQKIAKSLSDMDALIAKSEKLVKKYQALKQACLQHMFPRAGQTEPDVRLPGFTGPWEQRKLGEMAESFQYGLNAAAKKYDGKNKYIRITDIDDLSHEFLQSNLTSPDTDISQADNYRLNEGNILFARTGASVGKTYIYKHSDGRVYYAGFLIRAKLFKEYAPEFIFQNTLTSKYKRFIQITSQRSGQPGVNAQEYADYGLMVPSLKEQKGIGKLLANLDHLITLHQRTCEKYKKIKQGMMEELLSGKIRLV